MTLPADFILAAIFPLCVAVPQTFSCPPLKECLDVSFLTPPRDLFWSQIRCTCCALWPFEGPQAAVKSQGLSVHRGSIVTLPCWRCMFYQIHDFPVPFLRRGVWRAFEILVPVSNEQFLIHDLPALKTLR